MAKISGPQRSEFFFTLMGATPVNVSVTREVSVDPRVSELVRLSGKKPADEVRKALDIRDTIRLQAEQAAAIAAAEKAAQQTQ